MNILEKITKRKKSEVYNLKNINSYSFLEKSSYFNMPTKNLAKRILEKKISIIAEHKRKSPSKSEINFLTKRQFSKEYFFKMIIGFCNESKMFQLKFQPNPIKMFQ